MIGLATFFSFKLKKKKKSNPYKRHTQIARHLFHESSGYLKLRYELRGLTFCLAILPYLLFLPILFLYLTLPLFFLSFLLLFKYSCLHFPATTHPCSTHPHLPPSILPSFASVYGSFIHAPSLFLNENNILTKVTCLAYFHII